MLYTKLISTIILYMYVCICRQLQIHIRVCSCSNFSFVFCILTLIMSSTNMRTQSFVVPLFCLVFLSVTGLGGLEQLLLTTMVIVISCYHSYNSITHAYWVI